MTPLEGIVIKTGAVLTVRLASRAIVEIARHPELRLGDTCYILYDFTRMQVRDVWTKDEYHMYEDVSGYEFDLPLPPEWEEPQEWAKDPIFCPDVSL
jgi:hypothetical protein